jgi:hypothetical protein
MDSNQKLQIYISENLKLIPFSLSFIIGCFGNGVGTY